MPEGQCYHVTGPEECFASEAAQAAGYRPLTVGGTIATLGGRLVLGGSLELLPSFGSLAGVVVGSTVIALTSSFGATCIASLDVVFARRAGEPPTEEEVLNIYLPCLWYG